MQMPFYWRMIGPYVPELFRTVSAIVAVSVFWPAKLVGGVLYDAGIRNDVALWTFASVSTLGFWVFIAALDQFPFMRRKPGVEVREPSNQPTS
jgi:hypothetical protein